MTDPHVVFAPDTIATGEEHPRLLDEIRYRAATQASTAAVIAGNRMLTYGELMPAAEAVAAQLIRSGVRPGEPVALAAVRDVENIVAMLGILLADAAFVPLEPGDPPARLAEMVADVGVTVAVAAPEYHSMCAGAGLVRVNPDGSADGPIGAGWSEDDEALCYIIHTSGTTGRAKGVGIPRRALDHFSRVSADYFDMGPGDRILQFFSLSFDACIEDIFPPLRAGATIVLRDDAMVASFDLFLQRCAEWAITILMLPTAYWHELVDAMVRDGLSLPETIRLVTIGGEEVRTDRVADWRKMPLDPRVRLVNEYGPTETTVAVTVDELAGPRSELELPEESTIGRPLPGIAVRVVDDAGVDVPQGHDGELLVGGPTVAVGYVGQPDQTAERFIGGPDGQRYYRTGDRVRMRADGRLAFGGRTDGQFKIRGYRIERAAVERALLSHAAVRDAVVDLNRGRGVLIAYLILDGDSVDEVRRHIEDQLPAYSVPSLLVPVAAFPRTDRDKVDVAALHRDNAATDTGEDGGNLTEARMRALVCAVLATESVGLDDSLIDIGAHSLAMVQISTRITREFGVRLSLADLHAEPTIRAIAAAVGTRERVEQRAGPVASVMPLTAFQRDVWLAEQLHPGTPLHTIGVRFRITGDAEPATVQAALDALVLRHDALRAVFDLHGDEPVMRFDFPARPVPLLVEHADTADAERLRGERGRTVLDPASGSLIAATLIIDRADAELIVAVHHLVFDGWSTTVLAEDLAALIDGAPLAPAAPFATELARPRDSDRDYWIERLTGIDTEVLVPTDRPRPAVRSFRGGIIERPIGVDRFERVNALAAAARTSAATVVLAAVQTLLAQVTGHTDITVLAPVAHRTDVDSERSIGAFVTIVPLRTDLAGDPDFRTVIARANQTLLGAQDHDDPPLAQLATALGVPAHTDRGPFTQVILMMQNTPPAIARSGRTSVEFLGSTHPGMTKLDLTFNLDFPDGRPVLYLEFADDLFDDSTAAGLADQFLTLLDAVTEDPDRPLGMFEDPDRDAVVAQYWRRRLAETEVEVELPRDRPRPPHRPFAAARVTRALDPQLVDRIREFCNTYETDLFPVVLAGLQAVISRYTGRTDITVVAGAPNPLPLRGDLRDEPSFGDLTVRVRDAVAADFEHQPAAASDIVSAADLPVAANRHPLGDVVLTLHHHATGHEVPVTIPADLSITFDDATDKPVLTIDYAVEMFDSGRIEALAGHLLTLLTAAMDEPATSVTQLPVLTASERDRLINRWNDSGMDVSAHRGVHELLEHHARTTPHAAALRYRDETMTYGQLNEDANRLAHLLRFRGVCPGTRVAICLDRGTDLFVALWAVLKAGGAYVPLDPAYPQHRLSFMLHDSAPLAVITRDDMAISLRAPEGATLVALDGDSADIATRPATDPIPVGEPSDAAYVMYTSGSTGNPKGVVVEHRHLIHAAAMWQHAYQLAPSWTYQQAASFSFDMFVGETLRAHGTGGRLLVVPRETLLDPGELYALMRTERVQCTELVPAVLRQLLSYAESTSQPLDFVEVLIGGGEKWSVREYERARRLIGQTGRVVNAYGVTEATVDNVYFDGDVDGLPADAPLPIGRPFPNNRVYILDAHQAPVPAGIVGELYLGGLGVARGYHEREELTAQRFLHDPFDSRNGARMYRTGDSARWRADGVVEFLGRLDDQVKVNGYRIELGEVEAALTALPAVAAAGAAVHHTSTGHAYLVGYATAIPGAEKHQLNENTIRQDLAAMLPPHLVPTRMVVVSSLPLTPNGKLDRKALPVPAGTDRTEVVTARTGTERRIAATWAAVLGIASGPDTIGIDDSFFSLGGDSFSALRVARRLDPSPPLLEMYRNPTIRKLADWFDSEHDAGEPRSRLHRLTTTAAATNGLTVVSIPYSGGSAIAYQPLADSMPDGWALYAAELPGHDLARPDEALLGIEQIAAQVVEEIRALKGPVLLYGHCLGVATTVEIAKRIEAENLPLVGVGLGAGFPTARLPGRFFDFLHRLIPLDRFVSDRQYLAYLRARGGFVDLGSREEEAFVLRNVRHDARDAEEYFTARYQQPEQSKLEAPVLSVVGARDRVTELYEERHREWEHLAEDVDLAVIPQAGHFFVRTHARQLAEILHDKFSPRDSQPTAPPAATPTEGPTAAAVSPRMSPDPSLNRYAAVAGGQIVSMLGSAISALVLSIWVFRETGSITQFSVISALGLLPGIIASPFAGAAADRWDRRAVMLASDLGAATAMGIVAALVFSGDIQMWQVYLAVSITSVAVAFQRPAYLAAVAQLVPKRYLGRTNGITQLGVGAATVIAPAIGVWLIGHFGVGGAMLLDIATFAVGVSTLLLVRFPNRLFRRREERFSDEILNGWRYIGRRPSLLAALRYFLVDNVLFLIGFAVIMPLLLIEQPDWVLSAALTAGGVGALAAGLVMGLWGGVPRRASGMLLFMGVCSIGITAVGVSTSPVLVISGMFLMSFGESMAVAHWMTLLQTKVGVELQGRVLSCFLTVMLMTEPLSYLLVGPLAENYVQPLLEPGRPLADLFGPLLGVGPARGLALLLVISGLLQFGWAVRGWLYRPVRFIEDVLPDAIPPDEIGDRNSLQRYEDSRLLDRH